MNGPSDGCTGQIETAERQTIDALTVVCIAIVSYLVAAVIAQTPPPAGAGKR
jgi:hypothetical protein